MRPRARFASSEEDEAPLARQVGDIRSCKSTAMMMVMAMVLMVMMLVRPKVSL